MAVVIAPWLETRPTDFSNATAEGSRLNLERRGQDIGQEETRARLQQEASQQAAQQALEQQRIAATTQIANQRTGLAATIAARKYAQQQAYQRAVQGGMDPIQAMMQFGPTMGQSMAGVGQIGLMQARDRMAALPPQFVADPNDPKRTLGVTYGGQFHPAAAARATVPSKMDAGDAMDAEVIKGKIQGLMKTPALLLQPAYKKQLDDAEADLKKITNKYRQPVDNEEGGDETGGESGGSATPAQNEEDPLGLFQTQ